LLAAKTAKAMNVSGTIVGAKSVAVTVPTYGGPSAVSEAITGFVARVQCKIELRENALKTAYSKAATIVVFEGVSDRTGWIRD